MGPQLGWRCLRRWRGDARGRLPPAPRQQPGQRHQGGAAASRASGILVDLGATTTVRLSTIVGSPHGVTATGLGSRVSLQRVVIREPSVSGVNVFKRAELDMVDCMIVGAGCDGLLLANGAAARLVRCKMAGCARCGACVLPGCDLLSEECSFERCGNGIHVGGRLSRWFGREGAASRLLHLCAPHELLRRAPGMCCIWQEAYRLAQAKLVKCQLTSNGVGVHCW